MSASGVTLTRAEIAEALRAYVRRSCPAGMTVVESAPVTLDVTPDQESAKGEAEMAEEEGKR